MIYYIILQWIPSLKNVDSLKWIQLKLAILFHQFILIYSKMMYSGVTVRGAAVAKIQKLDFFLQMPKTRGRANINLNFPATLTTRSARSAEKQNGFFHRKIEFQPHARTRPYNHSETKMIRKWNIIVLVVLLAYIGALLWNGTSICLKPFLACGIGNIEQNYRKYLWAVEPNQCVVFLWLSFGRYSLDATEVQF